MSEAMESTCAYGFGQTLKHTTLDAVLERVTQALKAEGFGVLTRIDVQETLKKKLGADIRPYVILGACNPALAQRALATDPQIGLLLPCNVVVRKAGEDVQVSIADPHALFSIVDNAALRPIVDEVGTRLKRVAASVHRTTPQSNSSFSRTCDAPSVCSWIAAKTVEGRCRANA